MSHPWWISQCCRITSQGRNVPTRSESAVAPHAKLATSWGLKEIELHNVNLHWSHYVCDVRANWTPLTLFDPISPSTGSWTIAQPTLKPFRVWWPSQLDTIDFVSPYIANHRFMKDSRSNPWHQLVFGMITRLGWLMNHFGVKEMVLLDTHQ